VEISSLFIEQNPASYTPQDHATWRTLYQRMEPCWERHATPAFLDGVHALRLDPGQVPALAEVNRFLAPRTGFAARAVPGYIPAFQFFDCLRQRAFPTTITIRRPDSLDYLPEPDIFHDIAGHVPMHTSPAFAGALVRFGETARTAAERARTLHDPEALASNIRALARFFWFTVEFGLMHSRQGLRAYGSGLLSSHGELLHSLESPAVQRFPMQLEWVINQSFEIHHYQPLLFVADGFDHLYALVNKLDVWMREGRLDHVAPGEPGVSEADLASFLNS
jgi:phenylalanine-4-hydroxylase